MSSVTSARSHALVQLALEGGVASSRVVRRSGRDSGGRRHGRLGHLDRGGEGHRERHARERAGGEASAVPAPCSRSAGQRLYGSGGAAARAADAPAAGAAVGADSGTPEPAVTARGALGSGARGLHLDARPAHAEAQHVERRRTAVDVGGVAAAQRAAGELLARTAKLDANDELVADGHRALFVARGVQDALDHPR